MPTNPAVAALEGRRRPSSSRTPGLEGLDRDDVRAELLSPRLEERYRSRGDWVQLVRHHGERAEAAVDPAERAQALRRAAEVCRIHLHDGGAARGFLARAFAACPDDTGVADDLDLAGTESAAAAAEVRAIYAGAADECELGAPNLAAELRLRAALLDVTVRRDPDAALVALARVSEPISTRSAPIFDRIARAARTEVLDALAALCQRAGDVVREKRVLLRSLERAVDPGDRAARNRAIAALAAAEGDEEGAAWHAREATRLDSSLARGSGQMAAEPAFRVPPPDPAGHDQATAALADRYWREQRWPELEPLLERLLRPGAPAGSLTGELLPPAEMFYRAGHVALELGKFENALRLFRETLSFDQVHLPALTGQAHAAAELGRWDDAHELYGAALLIQRSLGRPPGELAESLCRMGEMREKGGQAEAGLTLYQSALDVHPAHRRALDGACRLHRERGDLHAVDRLLRAALARAGRRRRVELLLELAGLLSRSFGDADGAVVLAREALALAPGERRVLVPLVEHCQAAGQWREAIEALSQLADTEASALRRGRIHHLAGGLAGNLSSDEQIEYLERALDCFFTPVLQPPEAARAGCFRAFRDLEAVLRARGDWKQVERAYRAMIKRLVAGAPELPQLWEELGTIYREHLGHPESAIQSYEVASALGGDRLTHHRILIDLYQGAAPDELDKLVERRRKLLAAEPFNPEHYSALRSLFVKTKNIDGTFCTCRALAFLDRADRQEDEFYRRHRPDGVAWPSRALAGRDWRRLRHPDEDPMVASVLALSAERVALSQATTARRLRLRDDDSAEFDHVRHLFRSTTTALGVADPGLFLAPEVEADAVLANLRRGSGLLPSFVIGRHMYEGRSNAQMVHTMARALAYTRPHAYLRLLLGPSNRVAAAFAAACAVGGGLSDGAAAPEVVELAGAIHRRGGREWLSELRAAVRRLRDRGGQVDVGRFCRGLDATSRRAGLLLTGALDVAAADLSREPTFARRRPREERLADLLIHSISEEHLGLRRELGLALDPGERG